MKRISIIGSGYVGQGTGKGFAEKNNVIFYDINKKTLDGLKGEGFSTTDSLEQAIKGSDISLVAVPTPSTKEGIDLSCIRQVTEDISRILADKEEPHVFIFKSTIVPGTIENVIIPSLEKHSNKKANVDFGVVFLPEFLTEIAHSWTDDSEYKRDFRTEDKIIIGEGSNKKFGDMVEPLFKHLNTPIIRTDYKTAEIIKYANNLRLATAISFSNEMYQICGKLGIDGQKVAEIVAMDKRIGKYGSVCGKAFGGKCFPKDLRAMIGFVENNTDHDPVLLRAVESVNETMKEKHGVRE
ncbi:MAG: nucleotide sugar dehydrogenase [Candidatus Aenigmatarchaeota archaeon]